MREFLQLLGRAESASEHPLGRAIYSYVQSQIELTGGCDDYEAVPGMKDGGAVVCGKRDRKSFGGTHLPVFLPAKGRGLRCTVDGQCVLVGNAAWLRENDVAVPAEATEDSNRVASEGKTGEFWRGETANWG